MRLVLGFRDLNLNSSMLRCRYGREERNGDRYWWNWLSVSRLIFPGCLSYDAAASSGGGSGTLGARGILSVVSGAGVGFLFLFLFWLWCVAAMDWGPRNAMRYGVGWDGMDIRLGRIRSLKPRDLWSVNKESKIFLRRKVG
ncbi:hypothetical protein C8R43DRAFT_367486 [Mycena crocata]|nr:hypothetical protein C8R43DRAFT_367486 [Mycena crocata]